MTPSYNPSFLVQAKVSPEVESIAAANNMTPEEFCRKAISYYSAKCVHTHRAARSARRGKVRGPK